MKIKNKPKSCVFCFFCFLFFSPPIKPLFAVLDLLFSLLTSKSLTLSLSLCHNFTKYNIAFLGINKTNKI